MGEGRPVYPNQAFIVQDSTIIELNPGEGAEGRHLRDIRDYQEQWRKEEFRNRENGRAGEYQDSEDKLTRPVRQKNKILQSSCTSSPATLILRS